MIRFCILAVALSTFWTLSSFAQQIAPPRVQWQKTFDKQGSGDRAPCLARTRDGGYILGGHSHVGGSANNWDYWVLRLDRNGNKLWQTNYGGWDLDKLWAVQETSDGGVILAGESYTPEPRIPFWVIRLDGSGNKLWDKYFGPVCQNVARAVIQTSDGGFLVAGTYCDSRYAVIRLNANGGQLWERSYSFGVLMDAKQTPDGGLILVGYSGIGVAGDKTSPAYGANDVWLVRIDADGNKLWDRSYGGLLDDGVYAARIIVTADGGYLVGANTMSGVGGNKESAFEGGRDPYGDYWILRLDAQGNKLWEQDLGTPSDEVFGDVLQSVDGAFTIAGWLYRGTNGAIGGLWLVRLDPAGSRVWEQTYNGPALLVSPRLESTPDGGFAMAASSVGDPAEPRTTDLALLKLSADAVTAPQLRFPLAPFGEGPFTFYLSGISNRAYITESSSDLAGWSPLATNLFSGTPVEIRDSDAATGRRFYRARMVE
jgi:hypothetical protein